MKRVKLGDICEINPRRTNGVNSNVLCSFIPMEYVDEYLGAVTRTSLRQVSEVEKGYTSFQNGDVLFAKITPCMENGKCAIAKNLANGIGFGSTEFHVIRAREKVIPEWVYYYLRQGVVRKEAERNMTGSAGQKRVPIRFLEEAQIPLPPLDEQKRIAAILSKADRLRRLRRYARELSDGYLQSVFLEMFGDPVSNPRGWERVPLDELGEVQGGLQLSEKRRQLEYKVPYLRVANVYRSTLDLSEIKMIGVTETEFERIQLKTGDVLIVEGHGNINEIGRSAIWDGSIPNCVHQNHLIRVRANRKLLENVYLDRYINGPFGRNFFTDSSNTTSGLNTISTGTVKRLPVALPPLPLQQKFAQVVQKYERLRAQQRESARQGEHLFQSLLHRAFRGEL